jgi:phosphatidylglycerophosphate synthase
MGKNTNRVDQKLKDFLGESKWKETIEQVKKWIDEKKVGEFSLRWGDLSVEYKRDRQDTINTAITAKAEEKAKEWICPRIPEWMSSDMLTVIGIIGILIVCAGFIFGFLNKYYLVLVPTGLIINWFGDSFDGSIARYRKKTRPNYGYYIDKIIDSVVVIFLALGLGLSGFVKIEIALLFGSIYLSLMLHADLVVHVQNQCKNSFGLFGPTEIRIVGIMGAILMYFDKIRYFDIYGHILTQYDFIVFGIAVIMFLVLVVSIIRKGIELNKQDTIDW